MIPGFICYGYDNETPEWSDFKDFKNITDDKNWWRSDEAPMTGEFRIVFSHCSLKEVYPEQFWVLFEPALSFFNGWEYHPDEIEKSSFVCIKVSEELPKSSGFWSKVEIVYSISVKDITSVVPEYTGSVDHLERIQCLDVLEYSSLNDEWFYFCGRDLDHDHQGNWMLIRKIESKYHLVLYSMWDYSSDEGLYMGNVLLSENFFNKLKGRVKST